MLGLEWAPLAGALVGLVVGLTGVGGGALMAPILLTLFGIDLTTVVATDLLFATITKLTVSGLHHKNRLVDWQIVKRLWLGSIPATLLIIFLAQFGLLFESPEWIISLLGVLILFSALSLLFGHRIHTVRLVRRKTAPEIFKSTQAPLTTGAGFILGCLVTATSVGAGALGAVMLKALYPIRMQAKQLIATDTLHAIPVSLLGGVSYLLLGFTDLKLLFLLLVGSVPTTLLGGLIVARAPETIIRYLLAAVLVLAGYKHLL